MLESRPSNMRLLVGEDVYTVRTGGFLVNLMWAYAFSRLLRKHRRTGEPFYLACPICHAPDALFRETQVVGKPGLWFRRIHRRKCVTLRAMNPDQEDTKC